MDLQKRTISTKQLAILVFIMGAAIKLFMLPVVMLKVGGRYTPLALVIFLLIDTFSLVILLIVSSKNEGKTAYEIIEKVVGKRLSKIIFATVFLCLLVKLAHFILIVANFTLTNLFDGMPLPIVLLPLIVLLACLGFKSLRSIGRTAEIFSIFILISLVMLMALVFSSADLYRIFPLFGEDNSQLFLALRQFPIWFGDMGALFIVLGKVQKSRHFNAKIITMSVITLIIVVVCSLFIYAMYIDFASLSDYGRRISAITHISVLRLNTGRFDKIIFIIWIVSIIISLGVFFYGANKSLQYVCNFNKKYISSIIIALVVFLFCVFVNVQFFYELLSFIGFIFSFVLAIGLPILLLICGAINAKKLQENHQSKSGQSA